MTKLCLVQPSNVKDWELNFLRRVESELSQQGLALDFQIVDHVDEADIVLHVDSSKSTGDIAAYRKLLQWADKEGKYVFALSLEDEPLGALPGIYTSLEPRNFDPALHLSWPHLEAPNRGVENAPLISPEKASLLYTFSGSCSHPLRRKLFSMYESTPQDNWKVSEIKRWYDHTDGEQESYITDILNSRFVLCPRGIAAYSHRIVEAMLLERVPVIIADQWVPFSFPEQDYYITIPEKELKNITAHLERALENYDFYLSNLRALKAEWLTEQTRYCKAVGRFLEFHREHQSSHKPKVLLERLGSYGFRKSNELLSYQKLLALANVNARRGKKMLDKIGL